ncbi:MAG TPA: Holliday junction branch migration protein RuvA [Bacillus sp. (in: firmicutes)]|uniref:Holliday junction branch migration protein RuvA n=1 Tax=Bacillus litorisediminis TaxID=2922713 RepID=UPI001FAC192E|nr:Holliday junction branch migration protein RuvA [Bacillus litorisediminis]HWO74781.1 Holliday junction branch migration protein RuvA [Bacillus sp. (in: firmicutes)]
MYEYLNGTIVDIEPEYIVVDVNGVGYQVMTPNPYRFSKQPVKVYTFLYVREDVHALYGFVSKEEQKLFKQLLNVTGIGPKGALAILAATAPNEVAAAIEAEDESFLTKFPGVGKKTARQMILDLKGKLKGFEIRTAHQAAEEITSNNTSAYDELEEAILALKALGYSEKELHKIKKELEKMDGFTVDLYVKKGLQMLMAKG